MEEEKNEVNIYKNKQIKLEKIHKIYKTIYVND